MEVNNEKIVQTKDEKSKPTIKNKKSKLRMRLVLLFIVVFLIISYINLKAQFLEYKELGDKYLNIFYTNLIYRYLIMAINFVILYFIIYFTNRGIKKGLKPFYEQEKKEMPKLLNKSISLVISVIVSVVISSISMEKIMLFMSNSSFGILDSTFNLDVSYFIFQKPLIEMFLVYFVILIVSLSIYMAIYYIIMFNRDFDGVDGEMLKKSLFMKKLSRNVMIVIVGIAILIVLNAQNMVFGNLLTINGDTDIIGAGITETTIKFWGYVLFGFVIIVFAYRALKYSGFI